MDLVEIDVVHAETFQAVVDLGQDGLAGKPAAVRILRPHRAMDLRGHHDLVAPGERLQVLSRHFFARAVGIDVGCVEEGDPRLDGLLEVRPGLRFPHGPGVRALRAVAVRHAAETDA